MTDVKNTVTKEQLDELVAKSKIEYAVFGKKLTVAVITLPSKFKVTGEASCVDAKNFNKELGETYALENAIKKLWELEGYLLANKLCTAPSDPDHELTEDEVATLASGGSLCDCCEFVQVGGDCPIEEGDEFDFGSAVYLLKMGKKVARAGWNGKGMYVYYVPAASYPVERNNLETMGGEFENDMVPYREYLALKTAQGDVATWSPSVSDALATDWCLA
jgi:hypothetical protein